MMLAKINHPDLKDVTRYVETDKILHIRQGKPGQCVIHFLGGETLELNMDASHVAHMIELAKEAAWKMDPSETPPEGQASISQP